MVDRGSSDAFGYPHRLASGGGTNGGGTSPWPAPHHPYLPAGTFSHAYTPPTSYTPSYLSHFGGYPPGPSPYLPHAVAGHAAPPAVNGDKADSGSHGGLYPGLPSVTQGTSHGYHLPFGGLTADPLPAHSPLPAHLRSSAGSTGSNSSGSSSPLPAHIRSSPYPPSSHYHLNSGPPAYLPPGGYPGFGPTAAHSHGTTHSSAKEPMLKVPHSSGPAMSHNGSAHVSYPGHHPHASYYGGVHAQAASAGPIPYSVGSTPYGHLNSPLVNTRPPSEPLREEEPISLAVTPTVATASVPNNLSRQGDPTARSAPTAIVPERRNGNATEPHASGPDECTLDLSRLQPVPPAQPTRTILNTPMVSPSHNGKSAQGTAHSGHKAGPAHLTIPNVPHPSPASAKAPKNGGWKRRKSSLEDAGNAKKLKIDSSVAARAASGAPRKPSASKRSYVSSVVNLSSDDPYSFDDEKPESHGARPPHSYAPVYKFKSALLSRESRSASTDSRSSSSSSLQNRPTNLELNPSSDSFQFTVDRMLEDFQTKTISVSNKPSLGHYRYRLAEKMEKKETRGRKKKIPCDNNNPLGSPPPPGSESVPLDSSLELSLTPSKTEAAVNGDKSGDDKQPLQDLVASPTKSDVSASTPKKVKKKPGRKKKVQPDMTEKVEESKKATTPPPTSESESGDSPLKSSPPIRQSPPPPPVPPSSTNTKKGSLWALPIVPKPPVKSTEKSSVGQVMASIKPVKATKDEGEVDISHIWRQAFGAGKKETKKALPANDLSSPAVLPEGDEPSKKNCLDIPPELRRKPRPSFGGLIHFAPDWQSRVHRHHHKCRIPSLVSERMKVEPKILTTTLGPSSLSASQEAVVSPPPPAPKEVVAPRPPGPKRRIVGDESGGPRNVVDSIIEKRRMRMTTPRQYKVRGDINTKMRMAYEKLPDEGIGLLPTPGLPLLTEDTTQILIGSNYGNFRRQTLLRYLDSLDESGDLKAKVLDWKPEVLETKTRRQYNQSKVVTNIREIFGCDLPVKAKSKKSKAKKSKPDSSPEKIKQEAPEGEEEEVLTTSTTDLDSSFSEEKTPVKKAPKSPVKEAQAESDLKLPPKKRGPGRAKKVEEIKEEVKPDVGMKVPEVPSPPLAPSKPSQSYAEEDYTPTEKEEKLQELLQGFALELLDDNPSWTNKVVIQNLVIWEPIDPVFLTPKIKKKPKKYKKRQSGLDFSGYKKKHASKSRDTSQANSPEPKESHPIRYSLDNVITESKNWVIDKGAGETILHRASKMGYPDVAAYAVDIVKMNPNLKDNAGIPPIHKAAFKGHDDIVQILLKYGVDPNTNVKGTRPLHEALESGNLQAVHQLLQYGSDPLLYDYSGNMPIDLTEDDENMRGYLSNILADLHGKDGERWNVAHDSNFHMPPDLRQQKDFPRDPKGSDRDSGEEDDDDCDMFVMEASSHPLPAHFQFTDREGHYVLLSDLKGTKVDLKKQEILEISWDEFTRTSHCCLLGYTLPESLTRDKALKLVRVEPSLKKALGIESSPVKGK